MRVASAATPGSCAWLAIVCAISVLSAALRDCSAVTLACRSALIESRELYAGFIDEVPPPPSAAACGRSASIWRFIAITSGWLSVRPRPFSPASCERACASAALAAPCGAAPAMVRGVLPSWPSIAAKALCAAARSLSTARNSLRVLASCAPMAAAPPISSGFSASNARRRCSASSSSACRSASCWSRNVMDSRISPRPPARFSSRKMSIIFWTMSCASTAFSPSDRSLRPLLAVIVNRLSCSLLTWMFSARSSTAISICRGEVTSSPIRVERTTFSRLMALVSVWRTRWISFSRLPAPMPICCASASSSCTKIRLRLS